MTKIRAEIIIAFRGLLRGIGNVIVVTGFLFVTNKIEGNKFGNYITSGR